MKTDWDYTEPVRYKLLPREEILEEVPHWECAFCLERVSAGEMVFHAMVSHGTKEFVVDSWPPEVNEHEEKINETNVQHEIQEGWPAEEIRRYPPVPAR